MYVNRDTAIFYVVGIALAALCFQNLSPDLLVCDKDSKFLFFVWEMHLNSSLVSSFRKLRQLVVFYQRMDHTKCCSLLEGGKKQHSGLLFHN